jgi:hypothetical protein
LSGSARLGSGFADKGIVALDIADCRHRVSSYVIPTAVMWPHVAVA